MEKIYYVSQNGSDAQSGDKDAPFKTLSRAVNKAKENAECEQTIYLRAGRYEGAEIKNQEFKSLKIAAFPGEKVEIVGGYMLDKSRFKKTKDKRVLNKIIDKKAREQIFEYDLSDIFGDIRPYGPYRIKNAKIETAIFINGEFSEPARYPKRKDSDTEWGNYIVSKEVFYEPNHKTYLDIPLEKKDMKRVALWSKQTHASMLISGYTGGNLWFDEALNISRVEVEKCKITTGSARAQHIPKMPEPRPLRFYFVNVFEELSDAREHFINRKSKKLYIYREKGKDIPEVYIGHSETPLINIDSCKNVTLEGVDFFYSRDTLLSVCDSEGVKIENCNFAHTTGNAITVRRSKNASVTSCDIYDTCRGGIVLRNLGDRYNLTPANVKIENSKIHNVQQTTKCYCPCIDFDRVCGVEISGCTLYNSPHNLILGLEANNNVRIHHNELFNAIKDTDDAGVIYWGRNPTMVGMEIDHNYFHDSQNKEATWGSHAIYMDDFGTGATIHHNVFYNVGYPDDKRVVCGSVLHETYNNIFIGRDLPDGGFSAGAGGDAWALSCSGCYSLKRNLKKTWGKWGAVTVWRGLLEEAGFFTERWKNYYKDSYFKIMWEILSPDKIEKIEALRKKIKNKTKTEQDIILRHFGRELFFTHKTKEGEDYPGTIFDYVKERFPSEYFEATKDAKDKLDLMDRENRLTADCSRLGFGRKLPILTTNFYYRNLSVGVGEQNYVNGKLNVFCSDVKNNFDMKDDKGDNGDSIFVKYGENFALTEKGLKYVKAHIEGFENIEMSEIGAKR